MLRHWLRFAAVFAVAALLARFIPALPRRVGSTLGYALRCLAGKGLREFHPGLKTGLPCDEESRIGLVEVAASPIGAQGVIDSLPQSHSPLVPGEGEAK